MTTADHDNPPIVPDPSVLAWMAFLANHRLDATDRVTIAAALVEEGPLAELSAIEARRTMRRLDALDGAARAQAWLYQRTVIHRSERTTGIARRAVEVLHRHDPVIVPDRDGWPMITTRSLQDWEVLRAVVRNLAQPERERAADDAVWTIQDTGPLQAELEAPVEDDLSRIELRRRVGNAPMARAAIAELVRHRPDMERLTRSLNGLDSADTEAVDAQILRLWIVAELRRLDRAVRPVATPQPQSRTVGEVGNV